MLFKTHLKDAFLLKFTVDLQYPVHEQIILNIDTKTIGDFQILQIFDVAFNKIERNVYVA